MTQKIKTIIGWVLTTVVALLFISSAAMKLTGGEAALKGAATMGLSAGTLRYIGLLEIASIVLFIIPRTALLGTMLLAAYMGGAIATHLEHGLPILMPVVIEAVVWITAVVRIPELTRRLSGYPLSFGAAKSN